MFTIYLILGCITWLLIVVAGYGQLQEVSFLKDIASFEVDKNSFTGSTNSIIDEGARMFEGKKKKDFTTKMIESQRKKENKVINSVGFIVIVALWFLFLPFAIFRHQTHKKN